CGATCLSGGPLRAESRTLRPAYVRQMEESLRGCRLGARDRHAQAGRSMLGDGQQTGSVIMTVALRLAAIAILWIGAFGATTVRAQGVPDFAAIIAAPDRSDADREIDKRRDPVKLLTFTGVRLGMRVLDMGAGGGYSTELMARSAGPAGMVYAQNDANLGARAKERFEARMVTPAMKTVVSLIRPFDDPLPADVRDLDLITFFFFYHDTTYMQVDRAAMNSKLLAA